MSSRFLTRCVNTLYHLLLLLQVILMSQTLSQTPYIHVPADEPNFMCTTMYKNICWTSNFNPHVVLVVCDALQQWVSYKSVKEQLTSCSAFQRNISTTTSQRQFHRKKPPGRRPLCLKTHSELETKHNILHCLHKNRLKIRNSTNKSKNTKHMCFPLPAQRIFNARFIFS